ncbi:MAG: Zn-ribbon domain-containing OB-fold protein [Elusimicrobia bacterium]|nr:Zn-ribbon domain-containing OB-fold protein [Elusimicrobiota bacterium]
MFKWFGKVNFSPYTRVADFARHLKEGRLMGSRCRKCGARSFPPRADCSECLSADFELVEVGRKAKLLTYTRIVAAPTGFEALSPYIVAVADLEEGGRILAWLGETVKEKDIRFGMELHVVPRIFTELEEIKVYYTLEKES